MKTVSFGTTSALYLPIRTLSPSRWNRNRRSIYCRNIIEKYGGNYPVWAFIEIVSFGELVGFYHYCANRFSDKEMKDDYYRLLTCKKIRNGAAHSNCILNDLRPHTADIIQIKRL